MAKKKTKFSFVNELHESVLQATTINRKGEVRLKRSDLKACIEDILTKAAKAAASGQRVRFPIIGTLVRKDVKARKAGKGKNPFTGEIIDLKAKSASKKPRWSFPRSLRETFANKRFW